jgi:hypothetical protein
MNAEAAAQEILEGPKPIAVDIPVIDIQMLFALGTSPEAFNQLILAKLKDAGAPVEGVIKLKLAHGKVYKMKTNPLVEQDAFEYLWLPDAYVESMHGAIASQMGNA